jgi:hypothetical protein
LQPPALIEQPSAEPRYRRWWLWTGLAAIAAGAVAVIVISRRGEVGNCRGLDPCFQIGGR